MDLLNKILCYKKQNEIKIICGSDSMIKVSSEDQSFFYGYDIFTDQFCKISKLIGMPLPKYVLDLISKESSRVKFANKVCRKRIQVQELLGISERTFYRMNVRYFPEEIKGQQTTKKQIT